jgi:hypothetical protein
LAKFPGIFTSTITKTPEQQPIQDAAITHHAEIIRLSFFPVAVAGNRFGCAAEFSLHRSMLIVCLLTDIVMCDTSPHFPSRRAIQ